MKEMETTKEKVNMDWFGPKYTNEEQSQRLLAYGLDPSTADKKKGKTPAWSDERLLALIGGRVTIDVHRDKVFITRKNGEHIDFDMGGITKDSMEDLVTVVGKLLEVNLINIKEEQ